MVQFEEIYHGDTETLSEIGSSGDRASGSSEAELIAFFRHCLF